MNRPALALRHHLFRNLPTNCGLAVNPALTVQRPCSRDKRQTHRGGTAPMGKGDKEKAEKVGDFLFRYMRARHRFKERVERPLPSNELATLIGHGKQEFDEIYIEPGANPPIVLDGKAGDVFDALIN